MDFKKLFVVTAAIMFTCIVAMAQVRVKGRVMDEKSQDPLAFVNIVVNGSSFGTTTDLDGYFALDLPSLPNKITFSYIGYQMKSLLAADLALADLSNLIVQLAVSNEVLQEVQLVAKENPAHRIIRNAVARRDEHKPENYKSFKYKSYNKFILTANPDSISVPDTLMTSLDTMKSEMTEFLEQKHFFIMESVSERKFVAPSRDSEEVLATRVSGFQNPTFALLATEFQSLSFYDDYISVMGREYLSPISKGSTRRYFFMIKDTIYRDQDSIFVIQFEPKRGTNFKGLKGAVYINTSDYALTNVLAKPAESTGFGVSVQQQYKKVQGYWFPYQLNADFTFGNGMVSVNGVAPEGISRSYLKDIEVDIPINKKEVSKVDLVIQDDAAKQSEDFWNTYREDSLSVQEQATYEFIDSIGEAENLEGKLKMFQALVSGVWPMGPVELDLDRIMDYNNYEGYRLGVGMHTSNKLLSWAKTGGYLAYGFKDKAWKYGADLDFTISRNLNWHAGYAYSLDVPESGNINMRSNQHPLGISDFRSYYVGDNRDWLEQHKVYTKFDLQTNLNVNLSLNKERFEHIEAYNYQAEEWMDKATPEVFHFGNVAAEFVYEPKKRVIQTFEGRMALNQTYPIYTLKFEQGFKGLLGSQFEYTGVHFNVDQKWKIRNAGNLEMRISSGMIFGETPYPKLVTAPGNMSSGFMISSPFSFETMGMAEFASSEYLFVHLAHDFGTLLINKKKFHPSFRLVHNMGYGSFKSQEAHKITRKSMDRGYFESGIEMNKVFSTIGVGVYYRYGFYQLPTLKENLTFKMTYSLPF